MHAMEAHGRSRGTVPLVLNLDTGQLHTQEVIPVRKDAPEAT